MIINFGVTAASALAGSLLLGSVKKGCIIAFPTFFTLLATFELSNKMISEGNSVKEVYIIHAGVSLFLYSLLGPVSIRVIGLSRVEFNHLIMLSSFFCLIIAIYTYVYAKLQFEFEQKVKDHRLEISDLVKKLDSISTKWVIEKEFHKSFLIRMNRGLEKLKRLKPLEFDVEIKENMKILNHINKWIAQDALQLR